MVRKSGKTKKNDKCQVKMFFFDHVATLQPLILMFIFFCIKLQNKLTCRKKIINYFVAALNKRADNLYKKGKNAEKNLFYIK